MDSIRFEFAVNGDCMAVIIPVIYQQCNPFNSATLSPISVCCTIFKLPLVLALFLIALWLLLYLSEKTLVSQITSYCRMGILQCSHRWDGNN